MKKIRRKLDNKYTPLNLLATFIMLLFSVVILVPLFWALMSSFKSATDWNFNKIGFPSDEILPGIPTGERAWNFDNYAVAFTRMYVKTVNGKVFFWQQAINSLIYAGAFTFASVFMHALVAYIVAKYKFKFGKVLYTIVLVTLMLPIVGSMSSGLQVRDMLHINGTFVGELLITLGGFGGMHFLIFYACFKAIPWSYAEAAQMDGAGHFMIFLRIMMPLAWSTVSAVAILQFIGYWNNYQHVMVYIPNMPTLSLGLFRFKEWIDEKSTEPARLAGTMMVALPMLILFITFRNKIMGNIAVGGLKG